MKTSYLILLILLSACGVRNSIDSEVVIDGIKCDCFQRTYPKISVGINSNYNSKGRMKTIILCIRKDKNMIQNELDSLYQIEAQEIKDNDDEALLKKIVELEKMWVEIEFTSLIKYHRQKNFFLVHEKRKTLKANYVSIFGVKKKIEKEKEKLTYNVEFKSQIPNLSHKAQ